MVSSIAFSFLQSKRNTKKPSTRGVRREEQSNSTDWGLLHAPPHANSHKSVFLQKALIGTSIHPSGCSLVLMSLSHGSSRLAEVKAGKWQMHPTSISKRHSRPTTHSPLPCLFKDHRVVLFQQTIMRNALFSPPTPCPENLLRRTSFEQISLNVMTSGLSEVILHLCLRPQLKYCIQFCGTQLRCGPIRGFQRKAMKMVRGLEHLSCEERLRETAGLIQPGEEEAPGRPHWGLPVLKKWL